MKRQTKKGCSKMRPWEPDRRTAERWLKEIQKVLRESVAGERSLERVMPLEPKLLEQVVAYLERARTIHDEAFRQIFELLDEAPNVGEGVRLLVLLRLSRYAITQALDRGCSALQEGILATPPRPITTSERYALAGTPFFMTGVDL